MKTIHRVLFLDSGHMRTIPSESVDLVVTSPPYPMIKMWDDTFSRQNFSIKKSLEDGDGMQSFELMHQLLDSTWRETCRVLKSGGFACINIGDAIRTINGDFVLYPNHSRILKCLLDLGLTALPCILWRKQTNAPNKFMGSGMLPAGAYVTLEHEYILILRKGHKRVFTNHADKKRRRESALFWEERNTWYSDVWFDIKGTPQKLNDNDARMRSGAYPFEVVYRLINMYSAKEDVVLDPFLGTGTTIAAAMASGRNSFGFEIERCLEEVINRVKDVIVEISRETIRRRLTAHMEFVVQRLKNTGSFKYRNIQYGFPVMTSQERELLFNDPLKVTESGEGALEVEYSVKPQKEFCRNWAVELQ